MLKIALRSHRRLRRGDSSRCAPRSGEQYPTPSLPLFDVTASARSTPPGRCRPVRWAGRAWPGGACRASTCSIRQLTAWRWSKSVLFNFGLEGQNFYNSQRRPDGSMARTSYNTFNFHDIALQIPVAGPRTGISLTPLQQRRLPPLRPRDGRRRRTDRVRLHGQKAT